ncbi:nicotinate-nucleotide-dimethylbenzimidazole phosphoribosyltransferase [Klebsiella pneumoniae subsp. ozaenae]|uniref:Nicotinate-nucleotide--dimethylbenzimidazole phosphoribosyltransferase n=1 Tax=Klebsiella pneumoniae subsp. ozaenae TaxID=574 RepID=A0A377ZCC1_KLEPO|nr:nicotinate-nucleotide-dimethylbenzimidazole phosphoribosyltransferase [Klebsiella pneumoniae subsp. ozaenae]
METVSALLAAIPQPDVAGMARAQQHIDGLLKPPGSLGRLETLAVQLAGLPGLQGQLALAEKAIVVMCADHGVWHEGVTPSPQVVTAIHAGNMVRGNTGVCVLAAQAGARVQVVDVGIDADPLPGLINLKVARGSGNIARTAAMSRQQAETVLLASMQLTRQLAADGVKAFGVGELGMANTTPAAATISVLTGSDPDAVVGCGANLPLAQRGHKVAVVRQAIAHNQPNPRTAGCPGEGGGLRSGGHDRVILGRPPVACRWCWMASSPMPLPWPPAAWPRRRTLILFLHTCRRRKERRSPSTRWVCGRISIWTCAWERAAAPRWRCTCWMPPA